MVYKSIKNADLYFKEENLEELKNDLIRINNKNTIKVFLGFDIAKNFHYLSILVDLKEDYKIYDIGEIKNNILGFNNLERILEMIINLGILFDNIMVGIEVTGSYYFSLLSFFKDKNYKNIYVINGSKIKNYSLSVNNSKLKNDKQDSITMCKYLYTNFGELEANNSINKQQIYKTNFLEISNLKFLYRQLYKEKQEKRKIMSRIKELTNRIMPEIFEVFKSASSKPGIIEYYIKSNFTREEIVNIDKEKFYEKIIKKGKINDQNQKNKKKIFLLHEIIKKSIGIQDSNGLFKYQMKLFVDKYYQITTNIDKIEELILLELKNQNVYIPKIKGAREITIGCFYAELGESIFLKDHKQIIGFIGWYPTEKSSGGKILAKSRLEKRGNKILREQVYLLAYNLCSKVPEINELKKKIMIKKNIKAIEALVIIGSILVRIISSLYKKAEDFDLEVFKSNYLE